MEKMTQQQIKVIALNTLNKYAREFFNYEKEYFNQFIGKNIFKVDGSIKAKFEHEIKSIREKQGDIFVYVYYWFEYKYNEFMICVKGCVNGGSYDVQPSTAFCQYEKCTLTLFKTDNEDNLLETVSDTSEIDQVYNLDELEKIAAEIKEAAKVYEMICKKMPYLFNEVFYLQRLTN